MNIVLRPDEASAVIESLRNGQPPKRFVSTYSVGTDEFIDDVRVEHLEAGSLFGRIRFISGTWGSGKTHFLRLLREAAFDAGHLVATVELDRDEAPFNKFERVFYRIAQAITSPEMYRENDLARIDPLGEVLRRAMFTLAAEPPAGNPTITQHGLRAAQETLWEANDIDADFRRIVDGFWQTYSADAGQSIALEERRALALSWFKGEGVLGPFRKAFSVQKMVDRANARVMLQSLSRLTKRLGYAGLVLLLDEGELSTSSMRTSDARAAHTNLRHLIDSIQDNQGLFAVYAATPDFFAHPVYGAVAYGALSQRIGDVPKNPPTAYERVWNLDALKTEEKDYQDAASRIRLVYLMARPGVENRAVDEETIRANVADLVRLHPERSAVSTWRIVIQGAIDLLDVTSHGRAPESADDVYRAIRRRLSDAEAEREARQ